MPSHPERVRAAGLPSGYQFPTLAEAVAADTKKWPVQTYQATDGLGGKWVCEDRCGLIVMLPQGDGSTEAAVAAINNSLMAHDGYDDDFPDREPSGPVEGCEVKGYGHGV